MNYDDRDDDEENLIYEESPPDLSDGMSIYELKKYKITHLSSSLNELLVFFSKSRFEQYIKLPASNFYSLKNYKGNFSLNPQGKFDLQDYYNKLNTSGFIFLNKKELLNCSKMSILPTLKYIEVHNQSFVITFGKKGSICYYNTAQLWWYCPSIFSDNFLSTLGCGDAFAGGFLSAYVQKLTIPQCLVYGTISAYCTMQSQSNMITRWFDKTSLQYVTEILYDYIKSFTSASELYKHMTNEENLFINLRLSLDESRCTAMTEYTSSK